MNLSNARQKVLNAEQRVTSALKIYGRNSEQFKQALRSFAKSWIYLSHRPDIPEKAL